MLYVHSSFAIIKFVFLVSRDGCVALPRGPWVCRWFVIEVFSYHTHLLFLTKLVA